MTDTHTPSIKISFYVLGDNRAQDILGFICDLTQKAINNSEESLLILMADDAQLDTLDALLWSFDDVSFVPHERLTIADEAPMDQQPASNRAPVLLAKNVPDNFHGLVLNTTSTPVTDDITAAQNVTLTRILEIIAPDASSMQHGRDKYKRYQRLGYELTHFKV